MNGVEYDRYDGEDSVFCRTWLISPDTAVKAFEAEMEDAGFNTDKNEYVYTVEGYEGDFAGDVQDFDKNGTWDNISIPTVHEDLVINITVENEDIAVLDGSDLILDVTDPTDAATPAWSIDIADGNIRYGFVVDLGDIDIDDVETVSWIERTSRNGQNFTNGERREATKADLYEVTVDGETAYAVYRSLSGTYNSSDKIVVRITNAEVSEVPEAPVEMEPEQEIAGTFSYNPLGAEGGVLKFTDTSATEVSSWDAWTLKNAVAVYKISRDGEFVEMMTKEIGDTTGDDLGAAMGALAKFDTAGNYKVEITVFFNGSGVNDSDTLYGLTGEVNFTVVGTI